jgi:hypothetical protein
MAGKALNKTNLLALGADTLADLLLEAVKGDSARQRRLRMALSAEQGPQDAAADIRKRMAAIRRARTFISRKAQHSLGRELTDMIGVIETRIAGGAPDTAFDLFWALLHLAPSIHERTDDSYGTIGAVMDDAMQAIARLAPRLTRDPEALADIVYDALSDNGYGQVDHAIPALAEALGETGLTRLRTCAEAARDAPLTEADLARYAFVADPARQADLARSNRDLTLKIILQDVADLQGDVDAWLARYTPEQLTFHTIVPEAAARLLAARRAPEALALVEGCMARQEGDRWFDTPDLDAAHFDCLEALGRVDALRAALRARFEARLCVPTLRRLLAHLPDFEDDEALHEAKARVLAHPDIVTALAFCLTWPDTRLAGRLVLARAGDLDGDPYEILTPMADALAPEHPLAAVLIWRSMIRFALERARSGRYGHAARHLAACAAADAQIADYGDHPDHAGFVTALRAAHGRKSGFWSRVGGPP